MKNKMIAIALLIVMVFALAACGSNSSAPAATDTPAAEAPAAQNETPAAEAPADAVPAPEPTELPIEDVIAANGGIEPDSGIHKVVSSSNGISFDFDSKYVTTENAVGNIIVYAGMEPSIPFCTVSLIEDADAVAYLKEMAEGAEIELGNSLQTKPGEPALVNLGGREIYYIYYTFKSKDVGSVVINAYYAENLENGKVVVYNSSALEGQTADVDAILKLAIETFALAV